MDDALAWIVRLFAPGLTLVALAVVLRIVANASHREDRPWSTRLLGLGLALAMLVPGIAFLIAVATHELMLPAAIAGSVMIAFGLRFLAVLRRDWPYRSQSEDAP